MTTPMRYKVSTPTPATAGHASAVVGGANILAAATLMVLAAACAPAPVNDAASPGTVAVTNATIIDGVGGAPIADGVVVVEGDRIIAAGPGAQVAVPDGAAIVDAAGGAVMPGLADMHVHMVGGWDGVSTEMLGYRRYLNALLHAGVTTVFDAGNVLPFIQQIRAEIEAGRLPGPRVYMAGPLVDGPVPIWPPSGSPGARITAEDRLTTYRAARSALSVVLLDLAGPCRESGKIVVEWRDSRARCPRFVGGLGTELGTRDGEFASDRGRLDPAGPLQIGVVVERRHRP